jgi:VWFA-related protein
MTLLLAAMAALSIRADAQEMKAEERITVERVLVDARVTDSRGEPIANLGRSDFHVRIDGVDAPVESAEWIPETEAARALADVEKPEVIVNESLEPPAPAGRLIVLYFQTDFARTAIRVGGEIKIMSYADKLLDGLDPEDRVAVLSFDSHLKFRLDFTNDKRRIQDAMRSALLTDDPPQPQIVPMPSLARHLPPEVTRNATTTNKAFIALANALRAISGPKSLLLFGWGMGERGGGGSIWMGWDYGAMRVALESARVTVFSLDITQADGHDLAVGLDQVAGDTGGFYASTYNFPSIAMDRLEKTLAGHYELEVRKVPSKTRGVHAIDVTVTKRGATVLARKSYVDKSSD